MSTRTRPPAQAIAIMPEYEVSQIPVVQAEPPLAAAEVVGAVHERDLCSGPSRTPPCSSVGGRGHGPHRCRPSAAARRSMSPRARLEDSPAVQSSTTGIRSVSSRALTPSPSWPTASSEGRARTARRHQARTEEPWALTHRAIHAGQGPDPITGAVVHTDPPRYHLRPAGVGQHQGSTTAARPTPPATLEVRGGAGGRQHGFAFASGMAAATPCCASSRPGDHSSSPTTPTAAPTVLSESTPFRRGLQHVAPTTRRPSRQA